MKNFFKRSAAPDKPSDPPSETPSEDGDGDLNHSNVNFDELEAEIEDPEDAAAPAEVTLLQQQEQSEEEPNDVDGETCGAIPRSVCGQVVSVVPLRDRRSTLTPKQCEALDNLRARLTDLPPEDIEYCDDACLVRFIDARGWSVRKAYRQLMCHLKWKREYQPLDIHPGEVEAQALHGGMYRAGFDRVGRPLMIMRPICDKHLRSCTAEQLADRVRHLVYTIEQAVLTMNENGGVEKMAWIIDFKGVKSRRDLPTLKTAVKFIDILSTHFPERLGIAILLDAPRIFEAFWKLVRPFMSAVTGNKVVFLSGDTGEGSMKRKFFSQLLYLEDLEENLGGDKKGAGYVHSEYWAKEYERFEQKRRDRGPMPFWKEGTSSRNSAESGQGKREAEPQRKLLCLYDTTTTTTTTYRPPPEQMPSRRRFCTWMSFFRIFAFIALIFII
eukprot:TRINITY_DN2238_c0_g1_i1.p1 TRINITY_DN2238_c0_g1~~TRINITY_DN2238_c0_g1_i1.p1  ORF type:complete len:453 (+),score=76.13 TRINITY_DN2238_c0_g1_i1:37-1359(+)